MGENSPLTVYRGCAPVVDSWFEMGEGTSLTQTLVHAIAEAEGVDPVDLSPLYNAVDVDALSHLFEQQTGDAPDESVFSFRVDRWNVFVRGDGRIRVCDATQPTDPQPVFGTIIG